MKNVPNYLVGPGSPLSTILLLGSASQRKCKDLKSVQEYESDMSLIWIYMGLLWIRYSIYAYDMGLYESDMSLSLI